MVREAGAKDWERGGCRAAWGRWREWDSRGKRRGGGRREGSGWERAGGWVNGGGWGCGACGGGGECEAGESNEQGKRFTRDDGGTRGVVLWTNPPRPRAAVWRGNLGR